MKAILNSDVYHVYQSNGICNELKKFAFNSHPQCYVDNGFCTDILKKFTNIRCLGSVMSSRIFDIFKPMAIQQVNTSPMITYFQFI